MKKHLLTLIAASFLSAVSMAQVVGITIEPIYTDDGTVANYPTGYTTYRIYADVLSENDLVLGVAGFNEAPLALSVPDGIWNHPEPSGVEADENNCNLYTLFPALEYDSYVTVGRTCTTDPGGDIYSVEDATQPWKLSFDTNPLGNGDILLNTTVGGAWNSLPTAPNGTTYANVVAGSDFRVLIAQITTSGSICGSFNVVGRPEGSSTSVVYSALAFGTGGCGIPGCTDDTALNYDMNADFNNGSCLYECALEFAEINITNPSCFGESDGSYAIVVGGNQDIVEMEINQSEPFVLNDGTYTSASNLGEGSYTVTIRDRRFDNELFNPGGIYGSCEVTEFIEIYTAPIEFDAITTSNVTCGGDNDGCANTIVTGGEGTLMYTMHFAASGNTLNDENGDAIMLPTPEYCGFGGGNYYFLAEDENGCTSQSSNFNIVAPPTLNILLGNAVAASCFNSPDGTQVFTWSGGTGDVDWSLEDDGVYDIEGGPSTYVLTGQTPGTYMMYASDVNGCTASLEYTINGGPAITAETTVMAPTCAGNEDATVSIVGAGGTGILLYAWSCDENYSSQDLYGPLAPGMYSICVQDEQGCTLTVDVEVVDAEPVMATVASSNISCNGEQDGSLTITAMGGTGEYTYSIDGTNYQADPMFTGLAAGPYDIYVLDGNNCEYTMLEAASIVEPAALTVTLDGFGGDGGNTNGFIDVTVAGGTPEFVFAWTDGANFTSDAEDLTGLAVGTYTLSVTDANGCTADLTESITITGINEIVDGVSFTVNPNPTNGKFFLNVQGLSGQKLTYNVLDTQGRLIVSKELGNNSGQRIEQVDVTGVAAGIYYIQLNVGDNTGTIKLVKN